MMDVMCIVPFDVMNTEVVCAFRCALEEAKGITCSEVCGVKVLTRSQARQVEIERMT